MDKFVVTIARGLILIKRPRLTDLTPAGESVVALLYYLAIIHHSLCFVKGFFQFF